MTPHRFVPYDGATDRLWDNPAIAYERGLSDSTRGLPMRKGQRCAEYEEGHREGEAWKKHHDPLRFTRATNVSPSR